MSTRHAANGSRQHGLASDPVYVAAQGIQGTIATKKAGILTSARARSLVYFLQTLSLPELAGQPNPGGLKRWVREFIKEFPERVGTPSMHQIGIEPGRVFSADQVRAIRDELRGHASLDEEFPVKGDTYFSFDLGDVGEHAVKGAKSGYPAQLLLNKCRSIAETALEQFLVSLCTDPQMSIAAPGEGTAGAVVNREEWEQTWGAGQAYRISVPSVPYFRDVLEALFEFERRFALRAGEGFAETSIAKQVFATLDAGLRLRRIVLVHGLEGIGKSEAARAWCARHLGEVRYVDLDGITSKKSFFSSLGRALGLPCSGGLIQSRVEAMLQRSGLMMVIDEAHYLWPQSERSEATPELVNWIDTALINRGVPVGLVTTPQFVISMQRVERKTGWNSGQFQRRMKRVAQLPPRPSLEDLELVARKLLPKASNNTIKLLVGYAGSKQRHHLDALVDAVKEAEEIAGASGRAVSFADVESAVTGVLSETDLAKKSFFLERPQPKRKRTSEPLAVADVVQERFTTFADYPFGGPIRPHFG